MLISIRKTKSFILNNLATTMLQPSEVEELKNEKNGIRMIQVEDTLLIKNMKSILNILSLLEKFVDEMQQKLDQIKKANFFDRFGLMYEMFPYAQLQLKELRREVSDFFYYVSQFEGVLPIEVSQLFKISQSFLPTLKSLEEVNSIEDLPNIVSKIMGKEMMDKITSNYEEVQTVINIDLPVNQPIVVETGKQPGFIRILGRKPKTVFHDDKKNTEITLLNKPIAMLKKLIDQNPDAAQRNNKLSKLIKMLFKLQKLMQELANLSEDNNWKSYPRIAEKIFSFGMAINNLDMQIPAEIKAEIDSTMISFINTYQHTIAKACARPEFMAYKVGIQSDKLESEMSKAFTQFENFANNFIKTIDASYHVERIKNYSDEILKLEEEKKELEKVKIKIDGLSESHSLNQMTLKELQQLREVLHIMPPSTTILLKQMIDRLVSEKTGMTVLNKKIQLAKEDQAECEKQLEEINKNRLILNTKLKNLENDDKKLEVLLNKLESFSKKGTEDVLGIKSPTIEEFNLIYKIYTENNNPLRGLLSQDTRDSYITSIMNNPDKSIELINLIIQERHKLSDKEIELKIKHNDNENSSIQVNEKLSEALIRSKEFKETQVILLTKIKNLKNETTDPETKFTYDEINNYVVDNRVHVDSESELTGKIKPEDVSNITNYLRQSIERAKNESLKLKEKIKAIQGEIKSQNLILKKPDKVSNIENNTVDPVKELNKGPSLHSGMRDILTELENNLGLKNKVLSKYADDKIDINDVFKLRDPSELIKKMITEHMDKKSAQSKIKSRYHESASPSNKTNEILLHQRNLSRGVNHYQRFKSWCKRHILNKYNAHENIYAVSKHLSDEINFKDYHDKCTNLSGSLALNKQGKYNNTTALFKEFSVTNLNKSEDQNILNTSTDGLRVEDNKIKVNSSEVSSTLKENGIKSPSPRK